MIRVAFFDIDGTLLEMGNPHMSESTIQALFQLREKGIKIVIATGRSTLRMPELPISLDGYINFNGQYCVVENKIIYENCLQNDEVQKIDIDLNEQVNVTVNNRKEEKPAIEKTENYLSVSNTNVKKLPVTGM